MARIKGLFSVSSNYEPTIAAPLDAREVVQFKSDLYARKTWLKNNSIFLYNGLRVSVTEDTEQNNGVYVLIDKDNYMEPAAWKKLATTTELDELHTEIEAKLQQFAEELFGHINDEVKHITDAERELWNNKVSCEVSGEQLVFKK